jgi:hypothetical protein
MNNWVRLQICASQLCAAQPGVEQTGAAQLGAAQPGAAQLGAGYNRVRLQLGVRLQMRVAQL